VRRSPGALFFPLLVLAACSGNTDTIDDWACPSTPEGGTPLTYEDFGGHFMAEWCEPCHASTAPNRNGAPDNVVFDTHDQVIQWKARIFARAAGNNDSMPLGPHGPSQEERTELADWLACGAP
jgi:hypothetical protein